jgi:protoheme IX farnesyltransferase
VTQLQVPSGSGAARLEGVPSGTTLRTYLAFVKPHIDLTFVLVALTGSVLAAARSGSAPLWRFVGAAVAVGLLSAGAECWTNLLDRDMDAVMARTRRRALPSRQITVRSAVSLGALLTATGLVIAAALGPLPLLFLGFALVDNVVVYSALTKRATPWSIVLGSVVGPLTLWAGYAAVSVPVSAPALLLGAMVAAWVPVHIWAIATLYRDDYARAGVPMAPVVWGRGALALGTSISALSMGAMATGGTVLIGGPAAPWAAVAVALLSAAVLALSAMLPWRPRFAGRLVRLVTGYLVVVLLVAIGLAA